MKHRAAQMADALIADGWKQVFRFTDKRGVFKIKLTYGTATILISA